MYNHALSERPCRFCGKPFIPFHEGAELCSFSCHLRFVRGDIHEPNEQFAPLKEVLFPCRPSDRNIPTYTSDNPQPPFAYRVRHT